MSDKSFCHKKKRREKKECEVNKDMPVGAALISADQILLSPAYDYIIDITDLEF